MDDPKTIGWLIERLKHQDPDQKINLVINGIEHPLTNAYFHPEQFLLVAKPPANCIEVISDKVQHVDINDLIIKNGRPRIIESIKKYREMSQCGLYEAKVYVEKVLDANK
jgi:hypothetical protein